MRVDAERVKKVRIAIDDIAARGKRYTFDEFCRSNKLYEGGTRERLEDIFIVCPFHNDSDPSLSINESKRRWKCFGCGAGGNYLELLVLFDNEVLGLNANFSQKANEILKRDRELQAKLGFSGVYHSGMSVNDIKPLAFTKFAFVRKAPSGYLELASLLKKRKVGKAEICFAIAMMQNDLPPEVIYEQVMLIPSSVEKKYSLAEIEEVE